MSLLMSDRKITWPSCEFRANFLISVVALLFYLDFFNNCMHLRSFYLYILEEPTDPWLGGKFMRNRALAFHESPLAFGLYFFLIQRETIIFYKIIFYYLN